MEIKQELQNRDVKWKHVRETKHVYE